MNWSTVQSASKQQLRAMLAKREQLSSRVEEAHASSTEESTSS